MRLLDWMENNNVNKSAFAQKLGISRTHLYEIMNQTAMASRKLAKQIQDATNGEVTIMELLYPQEQKENE